MPLGLCREEVSIGILGGKRADELPCRVVRLIVQQWMIQRCDQVNALAARQFRPWLKSLVLHKLPQLQGRLDHFLPRHALTRIEIDHEAIGMLDVVYGRVPGMQLYRANLDQPKKSFEAIGPEPRALATLSLLDVELMHRLRNVLWQLALVVKRSCHEHAGPA